MNMFHLIDFMIFVTPNGISNVPGISQWQPSWILSRTETSFKIENSWGGGEARPFPAFSSMSSHADFVNISAYRVAIAGNGEKKTIETDRFGKVSKTKTGQEFEETT